MIDLDHCQWLCKYIVQNVAVLATLVYVLRSLATRTDASGKHRRPFTVRKTLAHLHRPLPGDINVADLVLARNHVADNHTQSCLK